VRAAKAEAELLNSLEADKGDKKARAAAKKERKKAAAKEAEAEAAKQAQERHARQREAAAAAEASEKRRIAESREFAERRAQQSEAEAQRAQRLLQQVSCYVFTLRSLVTRSTVSCASCLVASSVCTDSAA
jgi:colicin import membrane protein